MDLKAHRWRRCLLGGVDDIYRLRTFDLATPKLDELPISEIDRDMLRTFPTETFFGDHVAELRNVLMWYAWTNKGLSYCQCFSFIAFAVYRVFHHNDRRHAMIDTYYSIHKLILLVKPLLPKDSNDASPLEYVDALTASVLLDVVKHDHALYDALKTKDVIKITILTGVSTLFLNWFSSSQGIDLLDFIVHADTTVMFDRVMKFLVAFFIVNREYFLHFEGEKLFELMTEKQLYAPFYSMLWRAKALSR